MATNKSDSYNKQPKKIYIIVNFNKNDRTFCNGLVTGLKNNFTKKGIQSDSYMHDSLSLEGEEDINGKTNDYNPEAVLLIQQTLTGAGIATFELTLIDRETKKKVWKGAFNVSTDSYSMGDEDVINKSVNTIVEKLTQDKII
jgi:hypothetical protein